LIVQPTASLELTRKSASVKKAGADVKDLIANSEVLSQLKTTQTIESLILPPETKSIITAVVKKVQEPETYSLAQWGLVAQSLSADAAVLNGVCILLHGHPGTGKTFAAGAIANSLNRELININASNMKSQYYGESQKIVRSTFDEMRRICTETSNPPVFLLNEADQLIHTRSNLEGSCSSTENATQNIILEELETFPGILIATTNLIDNLDAAFSRRFHYKIELCLPDEDCRKQLWKLHLPATIPGAEDIDIAYLAKKHCISGGQIKVIVQNACSAAIIRETEQRRLSMIDIVKYAELEDGNSFEVKTKQIGFALH
jgi:SpoVK/Ycf46/Vps4 family AAA+-type ATPase